MNNHTCLIGIYHQSDCSELVTLEELQLNILETRQYNYMLQHDPFLSGATGLYKKEYTLRDYADKRKSTNLYRFDFCPSCGKPIDWKAIRRLTDDKI